MNPSPSGFLCVTAPKPEDSRRPNLMQASSALIDFEPPPFIVESLPLTIRWRLGRPLEGSIQVVLASFQQRPTLAQLTPNFIADIEPNLQYVTIPRMDLAPGSYIVLAMNGTTRDSILAASQSFYFSPPASASTSAPSDSIAQANNTNSQTSRACDISKLTTILTPHSDVQMIVLISMTAVLILVGVITLFITLRKSFLHRRTKDCQTNSDEPDILHPPRCTDIRPSPDIHPFPPIDVHLSPSTGSLSYLAPVPPFRQQISSPTYSLASKQRPSPSENTTSLSRSVDRHNTSPPPRYHSDIYV